MKNNLQTIINLRPSVIGDKGFIYSTWLKGLYYGNDWFKAIDQDAYFSNYQKTLDSILARPDTVVTVACMIADPDTIVGYSVSGLDVTKQPILHWVWVKPVWRNNAICTDLVPKNLVAVTHLTKSGKAMLPTNVMFNPFLI